jgi:hypothetical protein
LIVDASKLSYDTRRRSIDEEEKQRQANGKEGRDRLSSGGRSPRRMKTFACLLVLLSSATIGAAEPLWKDVCTQPETKVLPFCNMSLVVEARVQDLLHRIPVRSQIAMMDSDAAGYAPLHIPPYQWWTEGLHGALQKTCFTADNRTACPSSFPCPSALATSFNDTLFYLVSSAIGKEGRAISNLRTHDASIGDGLSYWTPVVNMARDPRWVSYLPNHPSSQHQRP